MVLPNSKSACAIVPLKPNELNRPSDDTSEVLNRSTSSTGIQNQACGEATSDDRCALIRRSCVLGETEFCVSGTTKTNDRPAAAAHASKWPMFPLRDEQTIWIPSRHSAQTAAPTSIGSPKAVPVPCASSAAGLLSPTAISSRFCDEPFGAVNDALGPSCCTADPVMSKK